MRLLGQESGAFIARCYHFHLTIGRLPANAIVMIVDKGKDFPSEVQTTLEEYGNEMWHFRHSMGRLTTRAVNRYFVEHRG